MEMSNAFPIRQQPRQTSPWKHVGIERQVNNLILQGKVKEFVKPLVLSSFGGNPPKNGSQRLCVDYRQLNALWVKDAFPLP